VSLTISTMLHFPIQLPWIISSQFKFVLKLKILRIFILISRAFAYGQEF